jgi:hypothetical protein
MSLSVIGAGLPRTGTWSLKLALEQLGFGPCYHMSEALDQPSHWPLWETAFAGGSVDFEALFQGWGSTTDAPGCHVYRELAAIYPDAKVVLGVREFEGWFASTQNTILTPEVAAMHAGRGTLAMVEGCGWGTDPRVHDKAFMRERFERHSAEVKATIPPERLLVFDAAEGWAPLCRFLGRPIPETPFPKVNSTSDFGAMIKARTAEAEAHR